MKLKIDFDIPEDKLAHKWPSIFTIGSCFADNQARRMKSLGIAVQSNPFGILYNPISIEHILARVCNSALYQEADFECRDTVFSWEHHGDFKYNNLENAIAKSNQTLAQSLDFLSKADLVIITLGTSFVYTRDFTIVANCHKQPNNEFEQRQLSFEETKETVRRILDRMWFVNNKARVIFTVSPIRHLRSGVIESSRSKAVLLAAIHEILQENKEHSYFPSYEIFVDELRDYRFAKADMTHPTEQAEEYIWQRFCETYFSSETNGILAEVKKYNQLAAHRPIHDTQLHHKQVTEKRTTLENQYPFLQLK